MQKMLISGKASGPPLVLTEGLSFWGGVDPEDCTIIDTHHPQFGECMAGRVVVMPASRGSCSGSGVLLALLLADRAPAALVFREHDDVLALGALVAALMFERPIPVLRVSREVFATASQCCNISISGSSLRIDDKSITVEQVSENDIGLSATDREFLSGDRGKAPRTAMQCLVAMAAWQGARQLTDVTRAHIDGCIYAHPANLLFAETMRDMGARVVVPTTMNAISVDYENWRSQGVPVAFGKPAQALASAYLDMGAVSNFTCAPYIAKDRPSAGESIGWSESNAVIYANSVLGARTVKHPDYLDLFIALTGRAPLSGVYLAENRRPRLIVEVDRPGGIDDAFWPLLGWLAGEAAPQQIPLVTGLGETRPDPDDLKALCAAFGTMSAAPMLHIEGITPEYDLPPFPDAIRVCLTQEDFKRAWTLFNQGPSQVDLVALGSPHFSLQEVRRFAELLGGRVLHAGTRVVITLGRETRALAEAEGLVDTLHKAGVTLVSDLCWCSITEPVFPPAARTIMTNSGKYAHYGPGLCGRSVRFGSLSACAAAALDGHAPDQPPAWLGKG